MLTEKWDEHTFSENFDFIDDEKTVNVENDKMKNNFNTNEHKIKNKNENQIFLIN